ncbi:MAG TPA: hypothetical protein VIS05_10220 [Ilumatobacter sp.]
MHLVPVHRRFPRAGIDPIDDAESALLAVSMAVTHPLRHETIVVLLDDARRGIGIVAVTGTRPPDAVVGVLDTVLDTVLDSVPDSVPESVGAVVLASVRPGGAADGADIDRWLEMTDLADQHGVELLEWFVVADAVSCPRDLLGEPPRW